MATIKSRYLDVSIPEDQSAIDFIFEKFDQYGDDQATVDGVSGRSYTFSQLSDFSRRIASALTRQGFKQGDVFGMLSPNLPEYVLMLCGIARMGGVISGANPLYTEDELVHQMQVIDAKFLITVPPFAEKALNARKRLPSIQNVYVFGEAEGCIPFKSLLADDGEAFPDVKIRADDTFALPFSSGTTGLPKGVIVTNKTVMWNLSQIEAPGNLDTKPKETALALLPYFHIYGLVVIMFHSLRVGARQVSVTRFEKETFLKVLQDYKVNHLFLVPPIIIFLAKHPLVDQYDLSAARQVLSGAAPLGGDVATAVVKRLGLKSLRQGFGMTESGPATHLLPDGINVPASVGRLVPNTEAKIVDIKTGAVLGEGEDGELCVRGPQITPGYFNNPQATADTLDEDGFLHTGDIGHFDKDELFYIVDRLKELIKYKGYQVPPAELEAILLTHPSVSDAAVIGVPDDEAGELPKAFVVKKNDELTEDEVMEFVAGKVAPFKKVREVEFISVIPKSASGKILRRNLRKSQDQK